jgi:hypothetical protein
LPEHSRNAADVVEMIMADVEVVDMLHPELVEVRNGPCAITLLQVLTGIEDNDLPGGRNKYRAVPLTDIDVMDLQFSIGLAGSSRGQKIHRDK